RALAALHLVDLVGVAHLLVTNLLLGYRLDFGKLSLNRRVELGDGISGDFLPGLDQGQVKGGKDDRLLGSLPFPGVEKFSERTRGGHDFVHALVTLLLEAPDLAVALAPKLLGSFPRLSLQLGLLFRGRVAQARDLTVEFFLDPLESLLTGVFI